MNHNQLNRLAAVRMLRRHSLLTTSNPGQNVSLGLQAYGLDLLTRLAEVCGLELLPMIRENPQLRKSRATFSPYFHDDPDVGGLICYDQSLPFVEQVFSIAHEFGHFALHRGQSTWCRQHDMESETGQELPLEGQVEVYNPKNRREREANLFALELLMPSLEVRRYYLQFSELNETHPQQNILERLAAHFRVSSYRLLFQLGNAFLDTPLPLDLIEQNPSETASTRPVNLDPDQEVAREVETPALVLAGPGAGKTRTLVERVRYLIEEKNIRPARLLVLTFSNKATGELRERLARAGLAAEEMAISTLHAYGADLLRRHAERAGLERDFRLLDQARAYMLMEDILLRLPPGFYVRDENPYLYLNDLLTDIGRAKDYLRTPDDYDRAVERIALLVQAGQAEGTKFTLEDLERARHRAAVYRVYEEQKGLRKLVDFGDLMMRPVQLLREDQAVLAEERNRYDQILVDEFQDINYASGELLRLLAAPASGGPGHIWAVGDINQSIYRFRGAYPRQAGGDAFQQTFAGPGPVNIRELSYNYRSLPPVVKLANYLRAEMPQNTIVELRSKREEEYETGPRAKCLYFSEFESREEEWAALAASIQGQRTAGYSYSDHAVLCRTNDEADQLAHYLTSVGIPAMRLGEFFKRPPIQEALSAISVLNDDISLGLVRLGRERLPLARFLDLARQAGLRPRPALLNEAVRAGLDEPAQRAMAGIANMLEALSTRSSMGYLISEYLFQWSGTVAELYRAAETSVESSGGNLAARQSLRALGQLIGLAAAFDREERDRVVRQEERRLHRPLTPEERDRTLQKRIRPTRQRQRFLRYKNALVRSKSRVELESADWQSEVPNATGGNQNPGAVMIVTVHKSKGLEFPFVYQPGLRLVKPPYDSLAPAAPGLHIGEENSRENDTVCAFYVGVTRAKDKLFLSWAKREKLLSPEEIVAGVKPKQPHEPGRVLKPIYAHREAFPHLWESLPQPQVLPQVSQSHAGVPGEEKSTSGGVARSITEINFYALMEYIRCPSRYYYKYELHGQAGRDEIKTRFYQGLAEAQRQIHMGLVETGELPTLETLQQQFRAGWPEDDTSQEVQEDGEEAAEVVREVTAADFQLQRGAAIIEEIWQYNQARKLKGAAAPVTVEFNQPARVALENSVLNFTIDRVETMPEGKKRLVRSLVRRPFSEDKEPDTEDYYLPTLYALAQPDPGNEVALETVGKSGVKQLLLPKAIKKATDYRRWQTGQIKSVGLLGKLDQAFQDLQAGQFEPNPEDHCLSCPYYSVICPARPI